MTHADVKELVAYAANYHVDILPEQEAFGHLHHVLKYEIYSPLEKRRTDTCSRRDNRASLPLNQADVQCISIRSSPVASSTRRGRKPSSSVAGRPRTGSSPSASASVYLDFLKQIVDALRPEREEISVLGESRSKLSELVNYHPERSELQCLDLTARHFLRPIHQAVSRRGNGNLGRARSE